MAVTRVAQDIKSGNGSTFDHSKASSALNVPAGALVIVKFSSPQSGNIATAPTDTAGNTYTLAKSQSASNEQAIWYCLNATANAANVVTSAFSNGCSEYGYSVEVYTGGTWTYDSANSGVVVGAYTTSPTVSPSLSTSGAGIIGTCFGQYDWPRAGNSATQTPGSIVNSGGDGTTVVMASGEVINASAFSGTISVNIQQPTPANTKCDLTYASFLASGGGSTNSLSAVGFVGALTCGAALAALNPGAANAATGRIAAQLTAGSAVLASAASATGASATSGALSGLNLAADVSALGAAKAAASLSQTNAAAAAASVGALSAVLSLTTTNAMPLAVLATIGPVSGSGTLTGWMTATSSSTVGPLATIATASASNGFTGVSATGEVRCSAALTSVTATTLSAVSVIGPVASSGALSAWQPASAAASVGQLQCTGALALVTGVLPVDPNYYAALGLRPFYGAQAQRPFYVSANARNFYVMANPNITPVLDTKDPREAVVVTLDGSNDLASGETLTSVVNTSVSVIAGTDAQQSLVVATPAINSASVTFPLPNGQTATMQAGKGVQAEVSAGLTNCRYLIAVTCNTSNPEKVLVLKAILPVSAS